MRKRGIFVSCLSIVLLTGCASHIDTAANDAMRKQRASDAAKAEESDSRAFAECTIGNARAYALDPKNNSVSAGDIADASLSKCALVFSQLKRDIENLLVAAAFNPYDPNFLSKEVASADETADGMQTDMRRKAVQVVIDIRNKNSN